MKKLSSIVVFGLLLLVIFGSLSCSCMNLKEGFDAVTSWKTNGVAEWAGPYSVTNQQPDPSSGLIFANNVASPECCKQASSFSTSDGCICLTKEQLTFLNERGGNRTMEDGC
jgi:hypothetical protein